MDFQTHGGVQCSAALHKTVLVSFDQWDGMHLIISGALQYVETLQEQLADLRVEGAKR